MDPLGPRRTWRLFPPPVSAEQKPRDSLLPPLEQVTEADAVVQKSPLLKQNSAK
jgi:hypothetical protein